MPESFSDVLPQDAHVTIGEKEYALSPLTPNDFAKVERYIKDCQRTAFIEGARKANPPLPNDVVSKTLAEIETTPVDNWHWLSSYRGRAYLVWMSSRVPGMTFEVFLTKVTDLDITRLARIVEHLTGLDAEEGETVENPLDDAHTFQSSEPS